MKTHLVHPVSALATVTVILGACLLSGMQSPGLSNEKQDILRHMTIVYLDDGQGGMAKTIRFTGVNVQVVNGLKSTNGFPFDPDSVDPLDTVVNSVGNLVVGYNELGNPLPGGDNRTGSHNIVVGHGREERYKLAEDYDPNRVRPSQWEMYDLLNDPLEIDNIGFRPDLRTPEERAEFSRLRSKLRAVEHQRLRPL